MWGARVRVRCAAVQAIFMIANSPPPSLDGPEWFVGRPLAPVSVGDSFVVRCTACRSPAFQQFIRNCLSKDPKRRFDARGLLQARCARCTALNSGALSSAAVQSEFITSAEKGKSSIANLVRECLPSSCCALQSPRKSTCI
jgi:hypothetical protein